MSLTNEEVNELLASGGYVDQEEGQFHITDLSRLTWAMRKIEEANAAKSERENVAKQEVDRIKLWLENENKKDNETIKYMESLIADYAERKREENPKYKSESTPYGKLLFKKQQPKWEFTDESQVAELLQSAGMENLVKVVPEQLLVANKTEFKKAFLFAPAGIAARTKEGWELVEVYNQDESQFKVIDGDVFDTISGEVVETYAYMENVVYDAVSLMVVPGVIAYNQPDKLEIGGK